MMFCPSSARRGRKALTLVELAVAIAILAIVAAFAVRKTGAGLAKARIIAAESDMKTLASALAGDEASYLSDMRGIPGFSPAFARLSNLLFATNVYGDVEHGRAAGRGLRVDVDPAPRGAAPKEEFHRWHEDSRRGWRGPYAAVQTMEFPARQSRRDPEDATFGERGFFPDLSGLWLPEDLVSGLDGASAYGFPGEIVPRDPWGNPYVLQVPPPQAFSASPTNVPASVRFRYARIVSAGPDGILDTPCFSINRTNAYANAWNRDRMLLSRQAGRKGGDVSGRGDDLVLFLCRADVDEGEDFR